MMPTSRHALVHEPLGTDEHRRRAFLEASPVNDGVVVRIGRAHDAILHRRLHHARRFFRPRRRAQKRVMIEDIFPLEPPLELRLVQTRGVFQVGHHAPPAVRPRGRPERGLRACTATARSPSVSRSRRDHHRASSRAAFALSRASNRSFDRVARGVPPSSSRARARRRRRTSTRRRVTAMIDRRSIAIVVARRRPPSRRVASSRRRRRPDAPESPDRRVTNGRIARKSRNAVLYFFRREVTPKALKRERDRAARESVFSRRAVSVNARSVARKRRLILSHTARRNSNLSTWVACTRPGRACPAPPCPTSARRRAG